MAKKIIKSINPVARAMLKERKPKQVVNLRKVRAVMTVRKAK